MAPRSNDKTEMEDDGSDIDDADTRMTIPLIGPKTVTFKGCPIFIHLNRSSH